MFTVETTGTTGEGSTTSLITATRLGEELCFWKGVSRAALGRI